MIEEEYITVVGDSNICEKLYYGLLGCFIDNYRRNMFPVCDFESRQMDVNNSRIGHTPLLCLRSLSAYFGWFMDGNIVIIRSLSVLIHLYVRYYPNPVSSNLHHDVSDL